MISEDTLTLVEGGQLGVRLEPNYFSQIVPFGAHERAEAIFQIEKIGMRSSTYQGGGGAFQVRNWGGTTT